MTTTDALTHTPSGTPMTGALTEASSSNPASDGLDPEELAVRVHESFSKKRRELIPIELVREVIAGLDLSVQEQLEPAPRLRLDRLRFNGEKHLADEAPTPIAYDQTFQPGINVLLIQDNLVGKSSIFKTIKFALTGDDSDYDSDVRSWIRRIWLHFSLGAAPHTVHLSRVDDQLAGYIAAGHVDAPLDDIDALGIVTIDRMANTEAVRDTLHRFFLDRFGLSQLSWTQKMGTASEERRTTWRTFFQALVIPDSSEDYLLLDEAHAFGNQSGLILSVFLGLRLAQPINDLLVEKQKAQTVTKVSEEERRQAEEETAALEHERAELEAELRLIQAAQRARRITLTTNPDARRLQQLLYRQGELSVERLRLRQRRDEINTQIQLDRTRARNIREAAALQLHFTGITVAVCPNCDADVDDDAVERERRRHYCRLCGKEAHPASVGDAEALASEADELEARAQGAIAIRDDLTAQLRTLEQENAELESESRSIQDVFEYGPDYALPTLEEQARQDELLQQTVELRVRIAVASAIAARSIADSDNAELRIEVQRKVRELLQKEAERLNASLLGHLAALTQDMVTRIGAESITDVTCSAVGTLSLRKHGVQVRFTRINNPGERLRVKLSFFLAMMRLGLVRGGGRHPGFLMIDQPGSDEIVDADFEALARVLHEIDHELADELQILCFTARPQFAGATAPHKVYGPQAGKYAF